ncbi:hypothetical protein BJX61DRAFT_518135 [Aspergillus egyptiacus]|nr:hypothetical protein BJX61DRAFT_518135 [Aspergillus egyptiacus]
MKLTGTKQFWRMRLGYLGEVLRQRSYTGSPHCTQVRNGIHGAETLLLRPGWLFLRFWSHDEAWKFHVSPALAVNQWDSTPKEPVTFLAQLSAHGRRWNEGHRGEKIDYYCQGGLTQAREEGEEVAKSLLKETRPCLYIRLYSSYLNAFFPSHHQ